MKKLLTLLATMSITLSSHSFSATFPSLCGKDLNGSPWKAPVGFPGEKTLLLIGFDEPQQVFIDSWIKGMKLESIGSALPWVEMPLIENPGVFMRWFIDTGMRGGIRDKATRARVWTAYTDKKAFLESCGITTTGTISVLVVERDGTILASETGSFTEAGAKRILKALQMEK
ncbi:MAG: hypothetical protein WCG66_09865 [bacterium]